MGKAPHSLSIFSQSFDRAVFLVYFLGAIVPFAALAWVTQRYVLPQLPDGLPSEAAGGALGALGCLSLASFLALRRVAGSTLARLDDDRRRLETLLETSQTLADARFADEVHRTAASCAAAVTGAAAAFVFDVDPEKEAGPPRLVATSGDGAMELYREGRARLDELVGPVLESALPALFRSEDGGSPRSLAAVPIRAALGHSPTAALVVTDDSLAARFDATHLRSLGAVAAQVSVARVNADLRDAQRNFFVHVTEILMVALDGHLEEPEGHSRRVAHLAVRLGRELGFDDHRLERLHFAGLLHDVGMLKVGPERSSARPAVRSHPVLGQRMLSRIVLWEDLAPFVLHHHECWDGSGYPEGLIGEDIPLEARILALAEAFDSTRDSAGGGRGTAEDALARIREGSGSRFEPRLADLFLDLVARGVIEAPPRG
jgi:HD domain